MYALTAAAVRCDAAVDPSDARVQPVKVVKVFPVYLMISVSITTYPTDGKLVVSTTTRVVTELSIAPLSVVAIPFTAV